MSIIFAVNGTLTPLKQFIMSCILNEYEQSPSVGLEIQT